MIYLFIYILLFILAFHYDIIPNIKANSDNKRVKHNTTQKLWYVFVLILFIVVSGLRSEEIGADTENYLRDFIYTPEYTNLSQNFFDNSRYQPAWIYFVSLVKTIFNDFNYLLLIQALFVNTIIFRFFKRYTDYPFLCVLLYFISYYIEFNTEILRESIALSICLLAYELYGKRKYIISGLLWLLAFNFHVSAIIALVFPVLGKIEYSTKNIIILLCIGAVLLLIFPMISQYTPAIDLFLQQVSPSLSERYTVYNNTEINNELNFNYFISLFALKLLLPVGVLFYLKEKTNSYFGFVCLYIILQILTAFTYGFYRFANYEVVFYLIMYADLIYTLCHKEGLVYRPLIYLVLTLAITYVLSSYQLVKETNGRSYRYERYIPYKFHFEK